MIKRKNGRKALVLMITGAFICAFAIIMLMLYQLSDPVQKFIDINIFKRTYSDEAEENRQHPYMSETTYDGTNQIDLRVFDYPFDNGTGEYLSNLDLYASYPRAFRSVYQKAKLSADTFFTSLLGTGFRTLKDDEKGYEETFLKSLTNDSIHGVETYAYMDDLKSFILENDYQGSAKFISDPSLVWYNDYGYMRGILSLEVYQVAEGADERVYADGLEVKDGRKYIVDLTLVADDDNNSVRVNDFKIVGAIKE